jgi:hypothetical protein
MERKDRIDELWEENRILREQIAALTEMINAVKLNDSVFVVGSGSVPFLRYLSDLEQRLVALDQQQGMFTRAGYL